MTDRQTDRQTEERHDDHIYHTSMASHSKNNSVELFTLC